MTSNPADLDRLMLLVLDYARANVTKDFEHTPDEVRFTLPGGDVQPLVTAAGLLVAQFAAELALAHDTTPEHIIDIIRGTHETPDEAIEKFQRDLDEFGTGPDTVTP
ncbi:hypothetical protein [Microbacterium kunmingense]|uniref:hypothetical protein n=1 Tax=Microbacterium kunmingense TaxID=2915939 RepID=UPI002005D383|nr:hypothetical protein [Microbacterium kunmingense]